MRLCHLTHRSRERSVLRHGLDPLRSRRVRQDTWLFERSALDWAVAHVIYRHGWSLTDLVLLEVEVPDELCLRTRVPCCRRCTRLIVAADILDCRPLVTVLIEESNPWDPT